MQLQLDGTWLAVMSACETWLTEIQDMVDEYQGLAAAFLVTGAQTVVASLWAVDDFSTALLMRRFHQKSVQRASGEGAGFQCIGVGWGETQAP